MLSWTQWRRDTQATWVAGEDKERWWFNGRLTEISYSALHQTYYDVLWQKSVSITPKKLLRQKNMTPFFFFRSFSDVSSHSVHTEAADCTWPEKVVQRRVIVVSWRPTTQNISGSNEETPSKCLIQTAGLGTELRTQDHLQTTIPRFDWLRSIPVFPSPNNTNCASLPAPLY
jgi:hypothetical protein